MAIKEKIQMMRSSVTVDIQADRYLLKLSWMMDKVIIFSSGWTNDDRFEFIIKQVVLNKHSTGTFPAFSDRYTCQTTGQLPNEPLVVCGSSVTPSTVVRDLGVWIDSGLSMSTHISKTVVGCFATLRQLHSVRRSLSHDSFMCLVVALMLSRLDYCNRVLARLPANQLNQLQSVLYAAAW